MADLDAVSTTVPIMVYYINMHTAAANGIAFEKAFAKAKIPSDVSELPGVDISDGIKTANLTV